MKWLVKTLGCLSLWIVVANSFDLFCPAQNYDYIVVGAGTAGCVLANRLSADGSTVLLLEYGVVMGPLNDIPSIQLIWTKFLDFTRKYQAVRSDKYCLGIENQRCFLPAGKAVGGGSAINIMFYTRGNRKDFDTWVEKSGATGWGWNDVLPYFVSLEDYLEYQDPANPSYGTLGERVVQYAVDDPYSQKAQCFQNAGTDLTKPFVKDGQMNIGFTEPLTTTKNGKRQDNYDAFIEPILRTRPNLKLVSNAFVKKIIFNKKTAVGVEFDINANSILPFLRIPCKAYARKEVLLSAGTFGSAQLLMLSGVGPKEELNKHKIPVVSDLPVGQNLQDHVLTLSMNFITKNQSLLSLLNPELTGYLELTLELFRYLLTSEGSTSVPSNIEMFGFVNISGPDPDTEFMLAGYTLAGPPTLQGKLSANLFSISEATYKKTYEPRKGVDGFVILPVLLHPYSRGNVTLNSIDPYADPAININYFQDRRDMDHMIKAVRWMLNLVKNPFYDPLKPVFWDIPVLGCENIDMTTDAYLECMIRHVTNSFFHYIGTCKMGNDSTAVVTPDLKVKGVDHLRVVDGSIMPSLLTAHTQAACQMIGAKGADIILGKTTPLKYF